MLSAFERNGSNNKKLLLSSSSSNHLLAVNSTFERMDEIFSSPSSNDSFRDGGSSVIECPPSADDCSSSLYIDTKSHERVGGSGAYDSASSPLSSLNVTPTYTFRRPSSSVGLMDDAAAQLSVESSSERVEEQLPAAIKQQKLVESVQLADDNEDDDDDVVMIFNDQHSLDYKPDVAPAAPLTCSVCFVTLRNGQQLLKGQYCSESCASISSFSKKSNSLDHEPSKRLKTAQTSEKHGQGCSCCWCMCESEDRDCGETLKEPHRGGREQKATDDLTNIDAQSSKQQKANCSSTSSPAFIQLKELDFNLKSDLIMQSNKRENHDDSSLQQSVTKSAKSSPFETVRHKNLDQDAENKPKSSINKKFVWDAYLAKTSSKAAPPECFINPFPSAKNQFKVGMCLEGQDPANPTIISALSVSEVLGHRMRLHFEGYDICYDFWRNCDSEFIYPAGHCDKNGLILAPPLGYRPGDFKWNEYLATFNSENMREKAEAPMSLFQSNRAKNTPLQSFEVGMKLEAVDKRNPILIRVATIVEVSAKQIRVHFDDWSSIYDFWVDKNSEDIHPVTWCEKTNHPLSAPNMETVVVFNKNNYNYTVSCPIAGCEGIGHIRGPKFANHHTESGCPYAPRYLKKGMIGDRFQEQANVQPAFLQKKAKKLKLKIKLGLNSSSGGVAGQDGKKLKAKKRRRRGPMVDSCVKVDRAERLKAASAVVKEPPEIDTTKAKAELAKLVIQSSQAQQTLVKPSLTSPRPRGRPAKNPAAAAAITSKSPSCPEFKIDKNTLEYIMLLNNVHESVYMVNTDEKKPETNPDLLNFNYDLNLLPGFNEYFQCLKKKKKIVPTWTKEDVANFIKMIPGCADEAEKFIQQEVDGEALMLIQQYDLIRLMKLKIGPAVKIFNYILMLRNVA